MTTELMTTLSPTGALPRWHEIETVLLDMDGTLLDLWFDNHFWLDLVPRSYAQRHALTLEAARATLAPRFAAVQGTLEWYCTDYWSRELSLDLVAMKHEAREHVRFLPGAEQFLQAMREHGFKTALVTNAHRDSLGVKAAQTNLAGYFDAVVSSHDYGLPKEHDGFWQRLQAELTFDPKRCLFVDDSLPVLQAARRHGIAQVFAVSRPDSRQEPRQILEFPAVESISELLESLGR
jgi:putative hydrolase of the HAD superfamily